MNAKRVKKLRQMLRKMGLDPSTNKSYGQFVSKFEPMELSHMPGVKHDIMPVAHNIALLPGCGRFIYQNLKGGQFGSSSQG